MDIGGFRDMHRHRRCVQIMQDYTTLHGYDMPQEIEAAGLAARYAQTMQRTRETVAKIAGGTGVGNPGSSAKATASTTVGAGEAQDSALGEGRENSQYLIPLAFRKRTLFKMDFAEALYISELRTGPAGHFSYRNVAYAMYEAVAEKYPSLAPYFRVTDVREPLDLLKR
jgi:thymidylate synthase ThyX